MNSGTVSFKLAFVLKVTAVYWTIRELYEYLYLKIEYQSETDFIYHENLRFKKD